LTCSDYGAYSGGAQGGNGTPAALENFYLYANNSRTATNSLNHVPAGIYNLCLYGSSAVFPDRGATFSVWTTNPPVAYASLSTSNNNIKGNLSFTNGSDYVVFSNVTVTAGSIYFSYVANPNTATKSNTEADFNGLQLQTVSLAVPAAAPNPVITQPAGSGQFAITWPAASGTNWGLYQTTNLAPPVIWSLVTNGMVTRNGTNQVNLSPGSGAQFFRLGSQ
jgi:hypothetical protein